MISEQAAVRTREKWVDDVKVIAYILVVLRHFFQSMRKANILPENGLLACAAVILLIAGFEEKSGKAMRFLARYTMPIFFDAHAVCSIDEICFDFDEVKYYECSSSYITGTWNQFYRTDYCGMNHEKNKVAGILFISK